jgi:hypothetical protein
LEWIYAVYLSIDSLGGTRLRFTLTVSLLLEVRVLTDKRLVVLRGMSSVTHSTDMDEFIRISGLTMSEVLETLKALAQDGFVTKTKHGYAFADKGKLALAALTPLPDDKAFSFYSGMGQPAGASARSIREFYDVIKAVAVGSLEFHLERGDFENWLKTSVKDDVLAGEFASLRKEGLRGEVLRKQILLNLIARFGEDVLFRDWSA